MIGFSGSRKPANSHATQVASALGTISADAIISGRPDDDQFTIAVGCARGLDAVVRTSGHDPVIFRADSQAPNHLVARSVRMVRSVASSDQPALLIWPGCACPTGLLPSRISGKCFCGFGSGTWASAALAVGLQVPIYAFGIGAASLPLLWGAWVVSDRFGTVCHVLKPHVQQLSLF